MINSLIINNYIIVDKIEINFNSGLQVLTGETGAGKSIILGALDIILGNSVKKDILFDKNKSAYLEASFSFEDNSELINLFEELDIEKENDEFFISKEISTNLKSKSFINGRRVTNSIVKKFRSILFDFHGQRDQNLLFDRKYQLSILDLYGNLTNEYEKFYKKYQDCLYLQKIYDEKLKNEVEKNEKILLYQFQNKELLEADLKLNELEELQKELNLLNNSQDILELSQEFEQQIYEKEGSVIEILNLFVKRLENYENDHSLISNSLQMIYEAVNSLDASVTEIKSISDVVNYDYERFEKVEKRLNYLNELISKYKKNIPDLIQYQKKIFNELLHADSLKEELKILEEKLEKNKRESFMDAVELSKKRRKVAVDMQQDILENIRKLALPEAKFKIIFDKSLDALIESTSFYGISSLGLDNIDFLFAANKGKDVQKIKDSASGGELSRLLLTLKKVLINNKNSKIIVFDEIDSGVGGKTADVLGNFIAKISEKHQVICITHLPQIAVLGENHFLIYKINELDKTCVNIRFLDRESRIKEIARMLSGSESEIAVNHAEELLLKNEGRKYD